MSAEQTSEKVVKPLGLRISYSNNARTVRLQGGPYDGRDYFSDHGWWNGIDFSHPSERKTHRYVPLRSNGMNSKGYDVFVYAGASKW